MPSAGAVVSLSKSLCVPPPRGLTRRHSKTPFRPRSRPGRFVHEPQAPVGVLRGGGGAGRGVVQIWKRIRPRRRPRVASVRRWVVRLCTVRAAPRHPAAPRRGVAATGMRHQSAPRHRRVRRPGLPRPLVPRVRTRGYQVHVRVLAVILQALRREVDWFRRGDPAEGYHAAHAVSRPVWVGVGTGPG